MHPGTNAVEIFLAVRREPREVRQVGREIDGVLSGSRANFEYLTRNDEPLPQHLEYRIAVPIGGLGIWLHGARRKYVR